MDRRSFLALIASAPIAALAPWPQFLPRQTILSAATGPTEILITSGGHGYVVLVGPEAIDVATLWRSTGGYTPPPLRNR